uniref:Msp4/OMP-like domain-containing protein n=1 Tax=Onchocerca volvulus TaxID=6282 RepID=A0A8R1U030_ONCVO
MSCIVTISVPNDVIWKQVLYLLMTDRKCFESAVYPASKIFNSSGDSLSWQFSKLRKNQYGSNITRLKMATFMDKGRRTDDFLWLISISSVSSAHPTASNEDLHLQLIIVFHLINFKSRAQFKLTCLLLILNVTTDFYKASFMAGGSALGYKMDYIRVDIEGLYSQLIRNTFETAPTPAI